MQRMRLDIASTQQQGVRQRLLEAAVARIRKSGYAATTVDQLCADAGVTKGAFFHHFKTKDALALATADYWTRMTDLAFEQAPFHQYNDPLDRLFGYLDYRKTLLTGEISEFTCLLGTMVQEVYATHPEIGKVYGQGITAHAERIETEIAAAMKVYRIRSTWTATSLALHTQAVLQGAFVIAKATGDTQLAAANIDHLRRYIELLFGAKRGQRNKKS